MLPEEQFDALVIGIKRPRRLLQYLRESPLVGLELKSERERDEARVALFDRLASQKHRKGADWNLHWTRDELYGE
jgi:hypothetical protein